MTLFTYVTTTTKGVYAAIARRVPRQYRPQASGGQGLLGEVILMLGPGGCSVKAVPSDACNHAVCH